MASSTAASKFLRVLSVKPRFHYTAAIPAYLPTIKAGSSYNSGPVGVPAPGHSAPRPEKITLVGKSVTLVPLLPSHTEDLYSNVGGETNAALWTYMGDGPYLTLDSFQSAMVGKSQSEDPMFFTVLSNKSSKPVGYTTLMRIDTTHRVVEVGNVMFSPALSRTILSTETHYLLMKYAFGLGYRRYEWKCDSLNAPSRRAAQRLGFTFEGIFRQHMIYKGRNRDTAWFSIIDQDWPGIAKGMETWLDAANFDADEKQIRRLEECRTSAT